MYTKLVRDIKTAASNPTLPPEFLVDLAAEYGEACEAVNHRLAMIVGLLSEGFRDEAIQLAEQNPNILDLVTQLDFPEREQWIDLLADNQLEVPPSLLMEAASQLEQAYDELRKLDPLLKKNRLLALAQAPLRSRILILKNLARQDPTNPIWPDDSEALQRARLVQIKEEYQRARAKNNAEELLRLDEELRQPWDIPIPKSLLSNVSNASSSLARDQAREQMVGIASWLNDCLLEYDSDTARQLRNQWQDLNQQAQLTPDDELFQAAMEPLRWLLELDEEETAERDFSLAVKQLENAIDEQVSIEVLDQRIYSAQKFEREIPESLAHRVNHYRDSLLVSKRRKTILIASLAAVVLIGLTVALGWFLHRRSVNQNIADARQQISRFVDEDGFVPGQAFFDSLSEPVKDDAEIIRLHSELVKKESDELDRQARFDETIGKVDLTGPLEISLNDLLNECDDLAKTDREKSQVEILRNQLNTARLTRQADRDQEFMSQLEPFRAQLETLTRKKGYLNTIDDLQKIIDGLDKLQYSSTAMVDGMAGISSSIKQNSLNLIAKAKSKIKQIEMSNQAAVRLGKLANDLNNFDQYALSLQSFADRFPNDPNSGGFARSAKEIDIWSGFEKWRSIADLADANSLGSIPPDRATELFEKLKAATQSLKITNWDSSAQELGRFLLKKQESLQDGKDLVDRLVETFKQAAYSESYVVERDDLKYYLAEPFREDNERFKYFQVDGSTRSTKQKDTDVGGKAPHCDVATKLIQMLKNAAPRGVYDSLIVEMLDLALARPEPAGTAPTLDPVVQCELIDQILLFAKYTSPLLKSFAEEQRNLMREASLVGMDWKAFGDKDTDDARKQAPEFLSEFEEQLSRVRDTIQTSDDDVGKMLAWTEIKEFQVVGFIYQSDSDWIVNASKTIEPDAPIYCLVPAPPNSATLKPIGNFNSGNLSDVNEPASLQAGRPILIRKPKN